MHSLDGLIFISMLQCDSSVEEPPMTVRNVCVMHLRGVIKDNDMGASVMKACQILLHALE